MREFLYQKIADIINTHCTWIEAMNTAQHRDIVILEYGKAKTIQSRMLTLRSCRTTEKYKKGHTWHLSGYDLNRVVSTLRKEDEWFHKRLSDENLDTKDVERIINEASFGVIKLNLSNFDFND